MADDNDELPHHIYEARDEKMVSIIDGKPKRRIARFVLPVAQNVKEAIFIPYTTPLLSDILPHNFHPPNVTCKSWNTPQHKWKQWVLQLAPKYETLWIKAGIRDAIFSSTYELRFNQEIVLGLVEFWCTETNTFVFPWGETTITLEDIMVLGGYPLFGELVNIPVAEDLENVVGKMKKFRTDILRSKSQKASHAAWLKQFMEEDNDIGHVAFLSLWLSRYVFPSRIKDTLDSYVFPIAVKLSKGLKVALGPAVLGNIYGKLREFTNSALESLMEETVLVPGNFQLLQVWAFERFPALVTGSKSPNLVEPGEPRMARWHRVNFKLIMPLVRSALRLAENFEWRPYAADLVNWHHRSFYKESEQLVFDCLSLDEELQSYVRCLRVSKLVGTDGKIEKYFPNRVAMQFGMDQDLPGDVLNFNCTSEILSAFIPSRSFRPGVSLRYSNWWKDSMTTREGVIKDVLMKINSSKELRSSVIRSNGHKDKYDAESDSYNLDEDDVPLSVFRANKARKLNTSPKSAVQKKKPKNNDTSKVSVGVKNLANPKCSSEVSKEAVGIKSRIQINKSRLNIEKYVYEDSSEDEDWNLNFSRFRNGAAGVKKRLCKEVDASSSCGRESVEKEKSLASNKEDSQEKVTSESISPVPNEVQSKIPLQKSAVQKNNDTLNVSVGLKNLGNPKCSSEVSTEAASRKSRIPITTSRLNIKKPVYEDSSEDDDRPINFSRLRNGAADVKKRLCKEVDSSSSCSNEGTEKEKSLAANKEVSQENVTLESSSPVPNEVQAKMAGGSMNPINIDDDSDNPVDDDNSITSSKREKDLERRIKTLEKMLGLSQG